MPFSTKEPETYRAVFVFSGSGTETSTFVAKSGTRRRTDHRLGTKKQLTEIQIGRHIVIFPERRIYAELSASSRSGEPEFLLDMKRQLLAKRDSATFEELDAENGLERWAVRIGEGEVSEAVIWVDPLIGLPVRHEFFTGAGADRTLAYSVEMREFSSDVGDEMFAVPEGFRKLPVEEFYRLLRAP